MNLPPGELAINSKTMLRCMKLLDDVDLLICYGYCKLWHVVFLHLAATWMISFVTSLAAHVRFKNDFLSQEQQQTILEYRDKIQSLEDPAKSQAGEPFVRKVGDCASEERLVNHCARTVSYEYIDVLCVCFFFFLVYVYVYIYICMYVCICTCICICICICICGYIKSVSKFVIRTFCNIDNIVIQLCNPTTGFVSSRVPVAFRFLESTRKRCTNSRLRD